MVYAGFGFFVAPGLVRSRVIAAASAYTGRPVSLGEVSTNSFTLSLTLRDLVLPDRNGERLFACDTLYVNFQASSLVRRAYTFAALRIAGPYLRTLVRADGTVNLQDVIPAADSGAGADSAPPIPVIIFRLGIARICASP